MYYASDVGAQVLREAAKRDWDGTVRWLREHPGKLGRASLEGLQTVVSQRLAADPAGTLRTFAQSGVPGLDNVLANAFLNEGYAQRDAVWEWLDQQPPGEFTRSTRGALLNAIGWKEPDVALEFLEKLPDSPENRQLLEQGTRSLINSGSQMNRFEELLGKASSKIRPILLETGFQYGFQYGQQGNNLNPAQWVERLNELAPEKRANAMAGLARGWAAQDPQAAVNWALALPDEAQRQQTLNSAVATWVSADLYEASEWINSLPSGSTRDTAARNVVGSLAGSEPESAWTWALSITTPEQRAGALQIAYAGLRKKDPAIAQKMLEGSNLSAAETKSLLERGNPEPPRMITPF
jgi:hypothetical protein